MRKRKGQKKANRNGKGGGSAKENLSEACDGNERGVWRTWRLFSRLGNFFFPVHIFLSSSALCTFSFPGGFLVCVWLCFSSTFVVNGLLARVFCLSQ